MKYKKIKLVTLSAAIIFSTGALLVGCSTSGTMKMKPPMGSAQDVSDAKDLWNTLASARLVGAHARKARPYKGQHPHGAVLETLHKTITVNGHTGLAIIKRNYGGPGVSNYSVSKNRAKYLKAVTVMFKRENGYDSKDKNWFWAKYKPNGALHTKAMPNGMKIKLAGRVAKGMPTGCISCHRGAGGGDFVFADKISVK